MASLEPKTTMETATQREASTNTTESPANSSCNHADIDNGGAPNAVEKEISEEQYEIFHDRQILCLLEDPLPAVLCNATAATTVASSAAALGKRQRCRMFRVIRSKGKALESGGFGVTVAIGSLGEEEGHRQQEEEEEGLEQEGTNPMRDETNDDSNKDDAATTTNTTTVARSAQHLFIEEVLFLHEKGLLRALLPSSGATTKESSDQVPGDALTTPRPSAPPIPLDTSQLYQLLPSLGIDLAVYRVYSHLRSQDFRVLRHDPDRYDILCRQRTDQEERRQRRIERLRQEQEQPQQENKEQNEEALKPDAETGDADAELPENQLPHKNPRKQQSLRLRHRMRESIQNAAPPSIPPPFGAGNHKGDTLGDENKSSSTAIGICWDAYNPNSNFAKTHPGFPDFYVTATYFNVPTVRFTDLKRLLRGDCRQIPLKVATVSDSGTVVMFGITDYGIPPLVRNSESDSY